MLLPQLLGPIVRSHGAVENCVHWVKDMIFRNDECRIRTDQAPAGAAAAAVLDDDLESPVVARAVAQIYVAAHAGETGPFPGGDT
jgi:hypothetical protein